MYSPSIVVSVSSALISIESQLYTVTYIYVL